MGTAVMFLSGIMFNWRVKAMLDICNAEKSELKNNEELTWFLIFTDLVIFLIDLFVCLS